MRYIINLVVDTGDNEISLPEYELEGDKKITDYLQEIGETAGDFISLSIKKLFDN